jgi:hypothetical protein
MALTECELELWEEAKSVALGRQVGGLQLHQIMHRALHDCTVAGEPQPTHSRQRPCRTADSRPWSRPSWRSSPTFHCQRGEDRQPRASATSCSSPSALRSFAGPRFSSSLICATLSATSDSGALSASAGCGPDGRARSCSRCVATPPWLRAGGPSGRRLPTLSRATRKPKQLSTMLQALGLAGLPIEPNARTRSLPASSSHHGVPSRCLSSWTTASAATRRLPTSSLRRGLVARWSRGVGTGIHH